MATSSRPSDLLPWDEQIQQRLARGEETALGELYDQFSPLVHGLAGRILDDQRAAEQLTREVFGHLWQHPEAFEPRQGSLRSWLGSLTHRWAVERLRRERGLPVDGDPAAQHAEEEAVRAVETAARVQYVVAALPHTLRETIVITYFNGHTYQEAARRLGITEETAKHRMRLGLQLLATVLETEGRVDDSADCPASESASEVIPATPDAEID